MDLSHRVLARWKTDRHSLPGGKVLIWDLGRSKPHLLLTIPAYHIFSATWSPDGTQVATSHNDRFVRFWDADTGELRRTLAVYSESESEAKRKRMQSRISRLRRKKQVKKILVETEVDRLISSGPLAYSKNTWDEVRSVAWSPSGDNFATGTEDGVQIWECGSWELKTVFREQAKLISLAWSPDGRKLASTSYSDQVCIFDIKESSLQHRLKASYSNALAWSPDGRLIASVLESDIQLWDSSTGKLLHVLEGHTNTPRAVSFSRDGRFLASGAESDRISNKTSKSRASTIRLWRTDNWT